MLSKSDFLSFRGFRSEEEGRYSANYVERRADAEQTEPSDWLQQQAS